MMAVIAEGRNFDRDDTLADAAAKSPPVVCTLSSCDIDQVLSGQRVKEVKPEQPDLCFLLEEPRTQHARSNQHSIQGDGDTEDAAWQQHTRLRIYARVEDD